MENQNSNGNPTKVGVWAGMKPSFKSKIKIGGVIVVFVLGVFLLWNFGIIKGLTSGKSKEIDQFSSDNSGVNTSTETAKIKVPSIEDSEFSNLENVKETRMINYIWAGNLGMLTANGGAVTVKGSLMEQYGVKLHMITNNSNAFMKEQLIAFIDKYANGDKNPTVGVPFITVMGDGNPPLFSTVNKVVVKAYGEEYKLKAIGVIGFSMGEDCLMGPASWLDKPSLMRGAIISGVIMDGDWGLGVRYLADITDEKGNRIPVNPDPSTYDENALNFVPSKDDDFMEAANDVIFGKMAKGLKIKDLKGRLTGKILPDRKFDGCVTWFPGDRNVVKNTNLVKIISTKQYPNQMGTTIVGCDKWFKENSKTIVSILSATYIATNQIKQYDDWFKYACDLAPKVFYPGSVKADVTAEEWYRYAKAGGSPLKNTDGIPVLVGGTQMANLADAKKYYGLTGGNDYYKAVYEYFAKVLTELNPCDIIGQVKTITPYSEVVDPSYLNQVKIGDETGKVEQIDYSKNSGQTFAKKIWRIEFETGSAVITPGSKEELKSLYESLKNWNEGAKCQIVGHSDNTGDPNLNLDLSLERARSVKKYLIQLSQNDVDNGKLAVIFPSERFTVDGKGQTQPIDPNANQNSSQVRKQNRRVEIALTE